MSVSVLSETRNFDRVLSFTRDQILAEVWDTVFGYSPLLAAMFGKLQNTKFGPVDMRGRAKVALTGGESIQIRHNLGTNATAMTLTGPWDTVDTTPSDTVRPSRINWRHYSATITLSEFDMLVNRGPEAISSLLQFETGGAMKYEDPGCAYCPPTVRACRQGEAEARGPGYCPTKVDPETQGAARALYDDAETRKVSVESAKVESEGYCKWTRVEEIVHFAKKMGYRKIGIANCISFVDHAHTLSGILESHGFEVVSVACKNGNIPKEELGLAEHEEVPPGQFETLCNPVAQADCSTPTAELNVVMGLCIGHDSLFFKYKG